MPKYFIHWEKANLKILAFWASMMWVMMSSFSKCMLGFHQQRAICLGRLVPEMVAISVTLKDEIATQCKQDKAWSSKTWPDRDLFSEPIWSWKNYLADGVKKTVEVDIHDKSVYTWRRVLLRDRHSKYLLKDVMIPIKLFDEHFENFF